MKLTDPIIAPEKLTQYLLIKRPRGDKSGYLARGGFTLANPEALMEALLALAMKGDAKETETDRFGTRYRLEGNLKGANGKDLPVVTIWMRKTDERNYFITLMPGKA
jgi:hypothetical protein